VVWTVVVVGVGGGKDEKTGSLHEENWIKGLGKGKVEKAKPG